MYPLLCWSDYSCSRRFVGRTRRASVVLLVGLEGYPLFFGGTREVSVALLVGLDV